MEKVIISMAHILRFNQIAWNINPVLLESLSIKYQLRSWKSQCNGHLLELSENACADNVIPQTWLIQQYFKHPLPRRAREIWSCLEKNIACKYIDKILLLNETEGVELPTSDKLIVRCLGSRMTYADVLRAIQTDVPEHAFAIFSNSDIYFDETLRLLVNFP
jgi:hypothetical protein